MILKFFNNNQSFFKTSFLFYVLLIIAFFFNLDPNGGAYIDYINQKRISQEFSENFIYEFFNFDKETTRHSPVLIIFLSFLEKIKLEDTYIRLINLHFCLLLPFLVYKIIILQFINIENKKAILLSCLIFLSPSFISLSIWPDSRIHGLLFFCISLIDYIKFKKHNEFNYALRCVFWYAIASYFSLNFALFSIFYIYKFFNFYKFNIKLIYLIILNLILASPALIYVVSLDTIFFFKSGIGGKEFDITQSLNFSNKILMISSIIMFYLIPFYLNKLIHINWIKIDNLIVSLIIFFICLPFFNYDGNYQGGGIFFKLSYFIFQNNNFFYLFSIISLIVIMELIKINFENLLIIFLLILSNIQFSIYHKYYDPFLFILLFSILDIKLNTLKLKNIKVEYFYFFSSAFLILNFVKQLL